MSAIASLCPDVDIDSLVADIDPGPREADDIFSSSPACEVWISELSPGGNGLIEDVLKQYADDPRRFFSLMTAALRDNDFLHSDFQMIRFLKELETHPDGDIAEATALYRSAYGAQQSHDRFTELRQTLAGEGYVTFHAFIVAIANRILRPGSGPASDGFLLEALTRWSSEEIRLGVELDARVIAYRLARRPDIDTALFDAGIEVPTINPDQWRFAVVYSLLWPRGAHIRRSGLNLYSPFADLPVTEPLLLKPHLSRGLEVISIQIEGWEQQCLARLASDGAATLGCAMSSASDLADAFSFLATNPVQADYISVYARVQAIRRVEDGVRTIRVLKAFILYESLQTRPDPVILEGLLGQLPAVDAAWAAAFTGQQISLESVVVEKEAVAPLPDDAEAAFEDGQYDRAYELYLAKPLHRKSLSVLLSCAQFIGTAESRRRLLDAFDAQPSVHADLPSALVLRLQSLRDPSAESEAERPLEPAGWMRWARSLAAGHPPEAAEAEVVSDRATWEAVSLRSNAQLCMEFSELIGNLTGEAADVARRSLPLIVAAFFPEGEAIGRSTKPVATVVLLLIAMDEAVAREDLEVLSTILAVLLELGLSTQDYLTTIADLEAIQDRVASFANLAWSLDVCEALAISPAPSLEANEARLRFFLKVVGQSRGFAHRLRQRATDKDIVILLRAIVLGITTLLGLIP